MIKSPATISSNAEAMARSAATATVNSPGERTTPKPVMRREQPATTAVILEPGTSEVRSVGITYNIGTAMPSGVNTSRRKTAAAAAAAAMIQPPDDTFKDSSPHRNDDPTARQ